MTRKHAPISAGMVALAYAISQSLCIEMSLVHATSCTTSTFRRALATGDMDMSSRTGTVEQVHISLIDSDRFSVGWVTPRHQSEAWARGLLQHAHHSRRLKGSQVIIESSACTEENVGSLVEYGTAADLSDNSSVQGSYICYSTGDYESDLLHSATIGPLAPSTTYYYRCSDPERGMASGVFRFTTPPTQGAPSTFPFRLGFVGDLGQTKHSQTTMQRLIANKPGIVVNLGDLSYADGYQPRWDSWGRMMQPLYATTLMQVIEGNHEYEYYEMLASPDHDVLAQSRGAHVDNRFVAYETRFFAETYRSIGASPYYYSFDAAGAHIIMLGSYAAYGHKSEQYTWLEHDLQSVDRAQTPWVIAGMHTPWMNSNAAHQGEGEAMRQALEQLLYTYRVDLVFSGHVHAYERTARVYNNKLDPCGPMYINVGDGGNREGIEWNWQEPQPKWSLYRESSYGHGILDLYNATHAKWQWDRGEGSKKGGPWTGADYLTIVKPGKC